MTLAIDFAIKDILPVVRSSRPGESIYDLALFEQQHEVAALVQQTMKLTLDDQQLPLDEIRVVQQQKDGVRILSQVNNLSGKSLTIEARLFDRFALGFRQFVTLNDPRGNRTSAILSQHNRSLTINLPAPGRADLFGNYLTEGIWHIWIGYDHIVFLISLLLPVAWVRTGSNNAIENPFKPVIIETFKVVSAFTVAHSLTLALTVFGLIHLPAVWVEAAIAASVVFAALNNVFLWIQKRLWFLAGLFGLIHGMGFASVLSELGLSPATRAWALVAFNLGVEIGQIFIVCCLLPFICIFSRKKFYRPVVLNGGSWCIALLASVWLVQRVA